MKNKLNMAGRHKLILISFGLALLISLAVIVSALTDNEKASLQQELSSLENNLSSQGCSWLINYSVSSPSVGVYREGDNRLLATFNNLNSNFAHNQIFLINLSDNESYDTFDLRSVGDVDKVPKDILLKKIIIDKIREEVNGGSYAKT
jgi:hypothetical protein